ncbi:MAG: hypothetical protein HQL72_11040 [Magnetococcales bacterium]|nr:hypothetical protein [Magnetococcales bacterium]
MTTPHCGYCRHFVSEPLALEREIPGLNILSSALGSVRGETGLCRWHDQFYTVHQSCPHFQPKTPSK